MAFYAVEIEEVLQKVVAIEAESEDEAYQKVKEAYQNGDIVLDADDFMDANLKNMDMTQEQAEELFKEQQGLEIGM